MKQQRVFTRDEVSKLLRYSIDTYESEIRDIFDSKHPINDIEERRRRIYRRYYRTVLFPELVLDEIPARNLKSCESLTIEMREFCYELIGNRSKEIMSLNDDALLKEVIKKLKNYKI